MRNPRLLFQPELTDAGGKVNSTPSQEEAPPGMKGSNTQHVCRADGPHTESHTGHAGKEEETPQSNQEGQRENSTSKPSTLLLPLETGFTPGVGRTENAIRDQSQRRKLPLSPGNLPPGTLGTPLPPGATSPSNESKTCDMLTAYIHRSA